MANFFRSVLSSARAILQNKTATPTTSVQVITPDSGYDGLAQVTVNAVNLQSKTTTMTPPSPSSWGATTTKLGTVTPDSGYTGLSQADISIPMIPDNTTLTLQSSGSNYDTYVTGKAGYVFSNSYLRVPKGSGGSETTLWTNSSPTSNFAAQNINLSQSISNFKFIRIYWRVKASVSTENSIIVSASNFSSFGAGNNINALLIGIRGSSGALSGRAVRYVSDTSLNISDAYAMNTSGSGKDSSIPTKITGFN